ncbi:unannotated protein [freshwater metagenome]|uniref:Unannotated protein n=1 Tax=freshwater metagenome TaxID=449393 RepID=A0A6J6J3M8_9ZZZZ
MATFGIILNSKPASGIRVVSKPLAVPINKHLSEGCSFFHSRATAKAGWM